MLRLVTLLATAALFTGSVADAEPRGSAIDVTDAPDGGWTWPFSSRLALHRDGVVYFGYVRGSDGSVVVGAYDEATDSVTSTVIASEFDVDDHSAPGLLIRESDGRIMAFYTAHIGETNVRYRVSTNPLDITSWGSEQTITGLVAGTYTYTSPVEAGGALYVFTRTRVTADSDDMELTYSKSTDGGSTWASAVRLSDLAYTKVAVDGDLIHFLQSQHPDTGQTSVYHFYMDASAGTFHTSDGTTISASKPYQPSDLTTVYDGSTTRAWVWDIAVDSDGDPVATFATFPGNDGSDHRAQRATWNGSSWSVSEVAQMGTTIHPTDYPEGVPQDFYSGGIVIDRADTRVSYVSRQVGSDWQLFRYPGAVQLTSGTGKNVRPVAVHDPGRIRALAMAGTYTTYVDYSVGTIAIPR